MTAFKLTEEDLEELDREAEECVAMAADFLRGTRWTTEGSGVFEREPRDTLPELPAWQDELDIDVVFDGVA